MKALGSIPITTKQTNTAARGADWIDVLKKGDSMNETIRSV